MTFDYQVYLNSSKKKFEYHINEIYLWCESKFGASVLFINDDWDYCNHRIWQTKLNRPVCDGYFWCFENKVDYTLFLLTWNDLISDPDNIARYD